MKRGFFACAARRYPVLLVACLGLAACNGEIYVRDGVTDGDAFYISPHAAANPDPVVQSWIRYSLARSVCQLELAERNPARATSFECEFKARSLLADAWIEYTLADNSLRDDYLDDLRFVKRSGYLGEYVARHFRKRAWSIPADLDMAAFERWRRTELRDHRPETRIVGAWGYRDAAVRR